ncbi:MAG: hypothetical protein C0497_03205 [Gemmatimonas sp.]|nr:hypothetical protein [Gemmatimonas sp.]
MSTIADHAGADALTTEVSDVYVARQPIFDRDRRLVGYELLYRPSLAAGGAGENDPSVMTGSIMVNSLLGVWLQPLTGGTQAWVNFGRESLLRHDFDLLNPRDYVIELLETVPCDEETTTACRELRARGFTLALDDFVANLQQYDPIVRQAQVVKLSVLGETEPQVRESVARLVGLPVRLLAEKVEDKAMYGLCRSLGFSLFQGHYFSRPETVSRKDLPGQMAAIARLMHVTRDPNSRDSDIERGFRADPGLSLKLLKIVNSAASGGNGIESLHHAIRLIGRQPLYRWLALLFATSAPRGDDVSRELLLTAIERGRFCEVLAEKAGRQGTSGSLFLTGLLSTFDAILGVPMVALVEQVRVSGDVEAALLTGTGPHAPILALATSYSRGQWDTAIELGSRLELVDHLAPCYAEASAWARDLMVHH